MSRKARNPITIPAGMHIVLDGKILTLTLADKVSCYTLPQEISLDITENSIKCNIAIDNKNTAAMLGTTHVNIENLVKGLHQGFVTDLQLVGIGYGVVLEGQELVFTLGKSHQDRFVIPDDVSIQVIDKSNIRLSGTHKGRVGEVADKIVHLRVPDSYKNKGIRYKLKTYINKEVKK